MFHHFKEIALHTTYEQLSNQIAIILHAQAKFASQYESDADDGAANAESAGGVYICIML